MNILKTTNYQLKTRKAFTLIEMLIATTIFAVVVVLAAGLFGSSSRLQVSTKASVNNTEYASLINNSIFNDLKSANGWYKVNAKYQSLPASDHMIKGFAIYSYASTSIKLISGTETGNLVIGAVDKVANNDYIMYYYDDKKLYNSDSKLYSGIVTLPKDCTVSTTVGSACGIQKMLGIIKSKPIESDGSTIQNLKFTGVNYISDNESGRLQPLLQIELTVMSPGPFGGGDNVLETKSAVSSRNYTEEP